jgi:SAM-dependent methyltransferase
MPTNESPELQRWNGRFSSPEYVFGTAPNAFLASQAHRFTPGQRALAVADGEGRNGVALARQGLDVLSVDFSPVGLAKAQKLAADAGVTLHTKCVDLATWSWDEPPFDVVVGIFIQFAGPALRAAIFDKMKHALKPGGLILLTGYRPEQLAYKTGGPSQLENLYTAHMLRDAFSDMTILHLAEHDDEINEGAGHSGMSALIDLVVRK